MKKNAFIVLLSLAILLVVMVACEENMEDETDIESIYEGEREMEEVVYVTAEEYMEFYGLTEENFVPIEYLCVYLEEHPRTYEILEAWNDYYIVLDFYNKGHVFGCNISELCGGEKTYITENDDFSDVTHIIIRCTEAIKGTEFTQEYNMVIDVNTDMYYYNGKDFDYTKADAIKQLTDEDTDELLSELRSIITPEWEQPEYLNSYHHTRWDLYLVKEDGSVIYY